MHFMHFMKLVVKLPWCNNRNSGIVEVLSSLMTAIASCPRKRQKGIFITIQNITSINFDTKITFSTV